MRLEYRSMRVLGMAVLAVSGSALVSAAGESAAPASGDGLDPNNLPPEMTRPLDELLDDPEGVAPDRKESRCVNRLVATKTEILDAEHLLFRSTVGGKAWLNRLSPGCIGLRPDMVLFIEGRGSSMCEMDFVYGQGRSGLAGIRTGRCSLGKFEPITKQHAQTLIDTFRLRSKEMAEARRKERVDKRAERRAKRKARREQKRLAREAAATT